MKTTKITYWTSTIFIFLLDGILPALTSHTELAREGISHLGYPDYFRPMLTIFKILGAIVLILPAIKGRVKEWAYAGFTFNFICAAISHWAVDGFTGETVFPLVALAILIISYLSYDRMKGEAYEGLYNHNLVPNR
jgi:hypothetical protein